MKEWSVALYLLDQDGKEQPANCFTKVTYNLHPSFENPNQSRHNQIFLFFFVLGFGVCFLCRCFVLCCFVLLRLTIFLS